MSWPTHADYQEAVQNPHLCFDLPELKDGSLATTPLGLPRVQSGNFASVYEVSNQGETFAVRCFVRQVANIQSRYARLEEYLSALNLPEMVPFQFVPKGIQVNDDWYPILKMDWVRGFPLHQFVERNVQDADVLLRLSMRWRELLVKLRKHHIGHGDLQHGNVLVSINGDIQLVDYDGMFIPAFAREKSPELGHFNYQHPRRSPDYYDETLDNFSSIAIHIGLLAVAAEPELWEEYHNGDNLILKLEDFKNPQQSKLLARLKESPDYRVGKLATLLQEFCRKPVTQTPDLETIMISLINRVPLNEVMNLATPAAVPAGSASGEKQKTLPNADAAETNATEDEGSRQAREASLLQPPKSFLEGGDPDQPAGPLSPWAVAAVIAGMASFYPGLQFPAGIGALVLVYIARKRQKAPREANNWMAFMAALAGLGAIMSGVYPYLKEKRSNPSPLVAATNAPAPATVTTNPVDQPTAQTDNGQSLDFTVTNIPVPSTGREYRLVPRSPNSVLDLDRPVFAFSPFGDLLIALKDEQQLEIRDLRTDETVRSIAVEGAPVDRVVWTTQENELAIIHTDFSVSWIDLQTGQTARTWTPEHDGLFQTAVSPDGRWIASGLPDRRSFVLTTGHAPGNRSEISGLSSWVKSIHFAGDNRTLAVVCYDDSVYCFRTGNMVPVYSFRLPDSEIEDVQFSSDARLIAATGASGLVHVRELDTGIILVDTRSAEAQWLCSTFAAGDRILLTGGQDGSVKAWNIRAPLPDINTVSCSSEVVDMVFNTNGKLLAAADSEGRLHLWNWTETDASTP